MLHLTFTEPQIATLKKIIETQDHQSCIVTKSFNTVWIQGEESDTEFRICFLGNLKLIISRVKFQNQRQGILSFLLEELKKICLENDVHVICIQSVVTKKMINFCLKHHFEPDPYATFLNDGDIYGDYLLHI